MPKCEQTALTFSIGWNAKAHLPTNLKSRSARRAPGPSHQSLALENWQVIDSNPFTDLELAMAENIPDPLEESLQQALKRHYAALAAWIARFNREPEPARPPDPTRTDVPTRKNIPSRQPHPPRPK